MGLPMPTREEVIARVRNRLGEWIKLERGVTPCSPGGGVHQVEAVRTGADAKGASGVEYIVTGGRTGSFTVFRGDFENGQAKWVDAPEIPSDVAAFGKALKETFEDLLGATADAINDAKAKGLDFEGLAKCHGCGHHPCVGTFLACGVEDGHLEYTGPVSVAEVADALATLEVAMQMGNTHPVHDEPWPEDCTCSDAKGPLHQ